MNYGIEVFLASGVKILSTSEMGVAFDLPRNGTYVDYNYGSNRYSQVEYPLSPIMYYWADSEQGIINQFSNGKSKQLCDNASEIGSLTYTNGHISSCTSPLLGLTNTVGSPASSIVPVNRPDFGLFANGELITLMQDVSGFHLKSNFIKRSVRMYRKRGKDKFNMPMMHLLIIPVRADEVAALYPVDLWKNFSIGLYTKTPAFEVYVIFSEEWFIDMQVNVYTRWPNEPVYPGYGLETYRPDGSKSFSTQNPPLLPIFVTNSESIGMIPPSNYKLGCVFSRVDTFFNKRGERYSKVAVIFNGISWESSGKWVSRFMGFTDGGAPPTTTKDKDYSFSMGALDSATWDFIKKKYGFDDMEWYSRTVYSLPTYAESGGMSKESLAKVGVFMGAVMY